MREFEARLRGPVLVVGKSGQLARCLQEAAIRRNLALVSVGRPELDLERGDDLAETVTAMSPAAIINAAAYTAVDRAEAEPKRAYRVNRDAAGRMAAVAREQGIPFIHVSTDYVFDGRKHSPYREDDQTGPLNVYGRSKLEGEAAVLKVDPGAIVLRTAWVYSPYGQNFVRTILRLSATQPAVLVVSDQYGSPTSALDLAEAILTIVHQARADHGSVGGIYHLTAQGDVSWHDFATAIFEQLARRGLPVPDLQAIITDDYPTPARRPANSRLDCSKAAQVFGVRLPHWHSSLEECLACLLAPADVPAC
ncbi:dTDP-4-dehydrorhamnose reductase [Nitrobacter hamburgensis X14]|uniref:dTDP-4-dehydrorhamnose reductase n=1 Tax=Nitrobacter hamburgensis (strain DSM 10229 / NCIMB 13809 / X14) TaxID=323097 RepID=Q1QIZ8_NITHX|nr:dTDP-4-dehydrorhamnose reductase [Nitrobacter hamburgensis X14]